jgi:hypothetical protein
MPNRKKDPETEINFLLFPSEYVAPEDGDRTQSRKRHVLNKRTMDAQNSDTYILCFWF